ncbi:hypothetical protein G4Z05_04225 [Bacillus thermocopriae]|uniref:Uncharacterized protein n=1 Tax=Neobacillus thermocopriae TaxID=1215031 RepID=A0A6B3TNX8_9BACI|nr:hypothetical protein [Neobacillus thermocopriae]
MHFITGGAFNGKKAWVKKTYRVTKDDPWISAYKNDLIPINLNGIDRNLIILEGAEQWIKKLTEIHNSTKSRELWNHYLNQWSSWEKEKPERQIVVIGTDITKGIVPLEAENRLWRDVTGWAFQDLAAKSDKIDVIWYGMNQSIK